MLFQCLSEKSVWKRRRQRREEREKENKICPMLMKKGSRTYIGTISDGKERTLKSPDSDVQLHIPQNVYRLTVGCVCTDNLAIREYIPKNECIIAPMVDFYCHSTKKTNEKEPYGIRIPHCLTDDSNLEHVRVRKVERSNLQRHINIPKYDRKGNQQTYFDTDEKYVTIFTPHFCQFTCCLDCKHEWCKDRAMVFLYGSIRPADNARTLVHIRPFICSFLYKIEEYKRYVFINSPAVCQCFTEKDKHSFSFRSSKRPMKH